MALKNFRPGSDIDPIVIDKHTGELKLFSNYFDAADHMGVNYVWIKNTRARKSTVETENHKLVLVGEFFEKEK